MAHKHLHNLVFLICKRGRAALRADGVVSAIKLNVAEGEGGVNLTAAASGHRSDSCKKLAHLKGLGKIIVCAGIKSVYLVLDLALCGEDKNGGGVALFSDSLKHRHTVKLGHHKVKDNSVVVSCAGIFQSLLAVINGINGVIAFFKDGNDRLGE